MVQAAKKDWQVGCHHPAPCRPVKSEASTSSSSWAQPEGRWILATVRRSLRRTIFYCTRFRITSRPCLPRSAHPHIVESATSAQIAVPSLLWFEIFTLRYQPSRKPQLLLLPTSLYYSHCRSKVPLQFQRSPCITHCAPTVIHSYMCVCFPDQEDMISG